MKYLMTGGTGFVGRAMIRHFLAQQPTPSRSEDELHILSRNPVRFQQDYPELCTPAWLHLQAADIMEPSSLPASGQYDFLIHAAFDSSAGNSITPLQQFAQILDGTRHVLDMAVKLQIPRVLFVSSGAVYGAMPEHLQSFPETFTGNSDSLSPGNAYGLGKKMAEHLCVLYQQAYGIEVIIARCFSFIGKDLPRNIHYAIGNFIENALQQQDIVIQGDGQPRRSWMSQEDLAFWLITLLRQGKPGQAYNVGSDEVFSLAEAAQIVQQQLAPKGKVIIQGKPNPNSSRNRYLPDITKAKTELGLSISDKLSLSLDKFKTI